jgi:hypothetical protein
MKDLLLCSLIAFEAECKEVRDSNPNTVVHEKLEQFEERSISTDSGKPMDSVKNNLKRCETALTDLKDTFKVKT